jgi:hypothetical protein
MLTMSHALLPRITSRTMIFIAWSSSSHHQVQGASSITFIEAETIEPIGTAEAVTTAVAVAIEVAVTVEVVVFVVVVFMVIVAVLVALVVDVAVTVPTFVVVKVLFTVVVKLLVEVMVTLLVVAGNVVLKVFVIVALVQPVMLIKEINIKVIYKYFFIFSFLIFKSIQIECNNYHIKSIEYATKQESFSIKYASGLKKMTAT